MGDGIRIRGQNLLEVLRTLDAGGSMTAVALAEQTGLSAATISRALMLLKDRQLIVQLGKEQAELGRRPELFRLNARYGYHLYFYLSGGSLKVSLQDFCGAQRAACQAALPADGAVSALLDTMQCLRTQLIQRCTRAEKRILAVSLAIPGLVSDDGTIARIPDYPALEGYALLRKLREVFGLPCFVYNLSRLCAMGEYLLCVPRRQALAYMDITDNCGIGAGLLLGGQLYEGAGGRAGEIGDMVVSLPMGVCTGTQQGLLEAQAGLASVYARVQTLLQAGQAQTLAAMLEKSGEPMNLRMLEKAAAAMDLEVLEVLSETTQLWAAAIVNLQAVAAPDEIIIGGAVSEENHLLEKLLRHHLRRLYHGSICLRLAGRNSTAHLTGACFFTKQFLLESAVRTAAAL